MEFLRFGDDVDNASFKAVLRHAKRFHELGCDLFALYSLGRLPDVNDVVAPVLDSWRVEMKPVPVLVGQVRQPKGLNFQHDKLGGLDCTLPIRLISERKRLARCSDRWYQLGSMASEFREHMTEGSSDPDARILNP